MSRDLIDLEQKALLRGECPFCAGHDIREGPSGGLCTNWRCEDCRAGFNLGMVIPGGRFLPAELIAEPQAVKP